MHQLVPRHPSDLSFRLAIAGLEGQWDKVRTGRIYTGTTANPITQEAQIEFNPHTSKAREAEMIWRILAGGSVAIVLLGVCDNLNTHTIGAFYEAFEPDRARSYVRRIDFCFTPKHGWQNIAENELSSVTRQCLGGRRLGELETLQREIATLSANVNHTQRGVDWQIKIDDARYKLKSVYPKFQC